MSLEYFRLEPALRIELAACEPQVVDPVEIRFGADGRLWVVEMRDYPDGSPPGAEPLSRVCWLADRDGDGFFEESHEFAGALPFATGLQPWRDGVFVTIAERIVFLADRDGDGAADQRETWYDGFSGSNPQLRANHPRLGFDGWIYVANGLRGGRVRDARAPEGNGLDIGGHDLAFDPRTGALRLASGHGQFGMTFDAFGRRFVCSNRNPLVHVVLEARHARRNDRLALPSVVHDVAAAAERSRIYPISRYWTTSNLHEGQFTAACGALIFTGDALRDEHVGNAFICEPTGNLVHREVLRPRGATFTSAPAREGVEFLASTDTWFRPVNLVTGPDGALYIADMYRAVIEHPEWMPKELRRRPDLRHGDDRGRIYRVIRDAPPARSAPRSLAGASDENLVRFLDDPGGWARETAARLLLERDPVAVAPALRQLAFLTAPTRTERAEGRVRALWTLRALDRIDADDVRAALADPAAAMREQGLVLAESVALADESLDGAVAACLSDEDARVRFHAALALGARARWNDTLSGALTRMALRDADDVWARRAVLTALGAHSGAFLDELLARIGPGEAGRSEVRLLAAEVASLAGAAPDDAETRHVLRSLLTLAGVAEDAGRSALQFAALEGLASAAARAGRPLSEAGKLRAGGGTVTVAGGEDAAALGAALEGVFTRAEGVALAQGDPLDRRREAVGLLAFGSPRSVSALARIAHGNDAPSLRVEAARTLGAHRGEAAAVALVELAVSGTPELRVAALDALLASRAGTSSVLDAVADARLHVAEIDPARKARLLRHPDAALRARAGTLLGARTSEDRDAVIERYSAAAPERLDPMRGRDLFASLCASCHAIGGVGANVGPDISDSRTQTREQLLVAILDPNRTIDASYVAYSAVTADGTVISGVVTGETPTAVTLAEPGGRRSTVRRRDLVSLRSTGASLMPDNLESSLTPADLAHLVAFIKNWRYLDGSVPLGDGE